MISFKDSAAHDPDLQFACPRHSADPVQVAATVARVAAWHRLAVIPAAEKRVGLILSTYPGKAHRMAHAVGLDAIASAGAMLSDLAGAGYTVADGQPLEQALQPGISSGRLTITARHLPGCRDPCAKRCKKRMAVPKMIRP